MSETSKKNLEEKLNEQSLESWYSTTLGERIAAAERDALSTMVSDLFGYQLIQLGALGSAADFAAAPHMAICQIKHKVLLSQLAEGAGAETIVCQPERVPIASDSVDAVILAHTLDFAADPRQVLREVERVLIAEGRVIVVGFNPFSLWGVWRLFGRWGGAMPWAGHFLSYPRLNDWLSLMEFDIERMDVMEFRPPIRSQRFESIERLGRRYWPMLAGVYVVRAVKRVSRVMPLQERWPRLRVLKPRAIEPTARGVHDA